MEKITKTYYKCEFCKRQYESEADAEECEEFHKKKLIIADCSYSCFREYAMPLDLIVVAEDGTKARYQITSEIRR